jgi:uncharacterized surface protein with fasciclin (FAS1) repeats
LGIVEAVEQAGKQVGVHEGLLLRIHASFPIGKSGGSRIISYLSAFSLAKRPFAAQPALCMQNERNIGVRRDGGSRNRPRADEIDDSRLIRGGCSTAHRASRGDKSRSFARIVSLAAKKFCSKPAAKPSRSSGQRRRSQPQQTPRLVVVSPSMARGCPQAYSHHSGDVSMSKRIALLSAVAFGALALTATVVAPVNAQEKTVMVGGAAMFPSKNIIQNAVNSKDHTTLVAAVKAAGLVQTLEGKGPFTVFAPTNAAFGKLPAGTVDTLVKPENKAALTKILTYHVVAGKLEASDLTDGKMLKTVEGEQLTVKKDGGKTWIVDAKGDTAAITITNVNQSNGVIHVIDTVLLPAS